MNIDEIQTSAPLEFRAVDDETKAVREFHFIDLIHYNGNLPDFTQWHHVDQFTGYTDKDGKKIYGGDVIKGFGRYFVVKWGIAQIDKIAPDGMENRVDCASFYFEVIQGGAPLYPIIYNFKGEHDLQTLKVIGNIHNLDALPEEVRRMVEAADD